MIAANTWMIFQGQTVENNKRKAFQTEEKFWEKFSEVKKARIKEIWDFCKELKEVQFGWRWREQLVWDETRDLKHGQTMQGLLAIWNIFFFFLVKIEGSDKIKCGY